MVMVTHFRYYTLPQCCMTLMSGTLVSTNNHCGNGRVYEANKKKVRVIGNGGHYVDDNNEK